MLLQLKVSDYAMNALLNFFTSIYTDRQLLFQFAKNDFKARYAGSMFGVFWGFINPVITVLTYWFVFGLAFDSRSTDGRPYIVTLLSGIVAWFYFSDVLGSATNVYNEYSYLVKKVVFNIRILPTVKLISNLYIHVFFICISIIITSLNGFYPTWQILQLFYYWFCLAVFLTGLTWITSSIQPFLPDINQFIAVTLQALMWGTPVLWTIDRFAAHPTILFILKLNPLYYIVQGYRSALLSDGWFWQHGTLTAYFWLFTLSLLLLGSKLFARLKPHFADIL